MTVDTPAKAAEYLREQAHLPIFYAHQYARMLEPARALGWCLALHGSLRRDCDVLAVPWVEGACPAKDLVAALALAVEGFVSDGTPDTAKACGRRAWTIHFGGPWIDLSTVDPRET